MSPTPSCSVWSQIVDWCWLGKFHSTPWEGWVSLGPMKVFASKPSFDLGWCLRREGRSTNPGSSWSKSWALNSGSSNLMTHWYATSKEVSTTPLMCGSHGTTGTSAWRSTSGLVASSTRKATRTRSTPSTESCCPSQAWTGREASCTHGWPTRMGLMSWW